jgi:hypothetical protein
MTVMSSDEGIAADLGVMSAADVAEFGRLLWLDGVKRRLRLVTAGETWIRGTHPYAFRSGEWARLVHEVEFRDRPCYYVRFEDGVMDYWAIDGAGFGYEFFPAEPARLRR